MQPYATLWRGSWQSKPGDSFVQVVFRTQYFLTPGEDMTARTDSLQHLYTRLIKLTRGAGEASRSGGSNFEPNENRPIERLGYTSQRLAQKVNGSFSQSFFFRGDISLDQAMSTLPVKMSGTSGRRSPF